MDKLLVMVGQLIAQNFWGEIVIKFKNGKIELIHKNEQIKMD